jgi:hypothetical protein
MPHSFSNKKFNHSVHEYLLDCDLINKYTLKNIYKRPKLKKVIVHFPINNLLQSNSFGNNLQVKSFLIFHVLFFILPFINFDKIKTNSCLINPEYSLKIILSNEEDIHLFLINLFVENSSQFEKPSLIFKPSINSTVFQNNNFCYNFSVPGKTFFDVDDFFSYVVKDSNFKELEVKCSFVFENFKNCKDVNNTIRNISFFWVNN